MEHFHGESGQAKNAKLMQLFADVLGMPVVLPESTSDAVSRGSAMLARYAAETQNGTAKKDLLWEIMVTRLSKGFLKIWRLMLPLFLG